jgi:hypothetical protein
MNLSLFSRNREAYTLAGRYGNNLRGVTTLCISEDARFLCSGGESDQKKLPTDGGRGLKLIGIRGIELWDLDSKKEVQKPFYGQFKNVGHATSCVFIMQAGRNILIYGTSKGYLVILREVSKKF